MTNQEIAKEMKELVSKFNAGISCVKINDAGVISVFTRNKKSVTGVHCDFIRSRAFASVNVRVADCGTQYVIEATPKQVAK